MGRVRAQRGKFIAMLHYAAPPILGGVETTLAHHARLFAADGHRVRVVCGRGRAWDPSIEVRRVRLADSRSPEIEAARAVLETGRVPQNLEKLVSRLEARLGPLLGETDLVIAHNLASLHKNLVFTIALHRLWQRRAFSRLVLWHHDFAWTSPHQRQHMSNGFPWDLLRSDWEGCTHVVVSASRLEDLHSLISLPDERVRIIPPGIDSFEVLNVSSEAAHFITATALGEARPLLLLPARITPRKNIQLALRILRHLRTAMPAAKLLITGPLGPHSSANREYADGLTGLRHELGLDGAVVFAFESYPAGLPGQVLFDLYRFADGLLMTSFEEGFGIPVLEAGIHALPVFLGDIPALRALAGEEGVFFAIDEDSQVIARRIAARLEGDPRFRLRARVAQEYTWEGVYRRHLRPLVEHT